MSNTTIFDNLNPMSILPDGVRETITAAEPNTLRMFGQNVFRARWIGGTMPEISAIKNNPDIYITVEKELTPKSDGTAGLEMLFMVLTMSPQL